MSPKAAWRLLIDGAADGAWNMAVDEAILDTYCGTDVPAFPTVRLYSWEPPTLSLGARQEARCDLDYLRKHAIGLVRRPTGGSAVLHEHERTYAIVGGLRRDPFAGGVLDTYRRVAAALAYAFRRIGIAVDAPAEPKEVRRVEVPACFERPSSHEITTGGRKIVGSAQVRRRGAFLQHGSILLRADAARLSGALGSPVDGSRFTGFETAMEREVRTEEIDEALEEGFAVEFSARLVPAGLTDEERTRATQLRCWKYDSAAWTLEGGVGGRERKWGPLAP